MIRFLVFICVLLHVAYSYAQENQSVLVEGVFAVIGDHVIFYSDIEDQILQYRHQGLIINNEDSIRDKIIEDLFYQKILLHFAAQDSLEVDVSELDNTVNQRILFFQEQLGSQEKVENYFNKSIDELIDELTPMIQNQLLIQKMQFQITKDVNVSPLDVENFYHSFTEDSLPIIPDQYQVAQILRTPKAAEIAVEETLSKLEDLRERILNGADFATMAILYSEDPGSSRNGGAYYNIKKGEFVREFESIAFSLDIDELSEIFKTEYGYHIAQLIQRKGNKIDVRHILMTPKISNNDMLVAKDFLDSLRLEIMDDEIAFEVASKKFSSDKATRYNGGLLINPNTNNSFFTKDDLDRVVYNEISTLSIGAITKPIYIKLQNGEEAYRIIKLVDKKEEHSANLDDDYVFLKNYCFQLKKEGLLQNWYQKNIHKLHIQFTDDSSEYDFYNNLLEQ
ncbi:MAG: hypothetical protein CMD27_03035 [Flavobacteriales bacterium]|nr:hypothetical protein [Flavobacteriales bacterium]